MKSRKRSLSFYLMLLIPTIILIIYHYVPMFGIIIAFQNYKPALGFLKSEFVGLENFRILFGNPGFLQALLNTVIIAFWKILFGLFVPLTFSLLLNEMRHTGLKRIAQTIIYLPNFISWILLTGIIMEMFAYNGVLNQILGIFGVEPIFFLGSNEWFKPVIIMTDIWKGFGWGTIIYMAALAGVDVNLYEAAYMDGAGRWKQALYITIPSIMPTVVLVSTLSLQGILNAGFDQIFNLLSPITFKSGDIIDTFIYRMGLESAQFSVSTAAGLFKSAVSCCLIVLSYKLADKLVGYKIF